MKLTMVIATRGRPELLLHTVQNTIGNISRNDTKVLICVDDDDRSTKAVLSSLPKDPRILISVQPREDSRGEKYDRALLEAPADIYLPAVDYAPIVTRAFDQAIINAGRLWPDCIGVVYTNMCDELVPFFQAPTARFVEKMGYIYSPDFAFWFCDHEIADIAWMIGRINFADVMVDTSTRPQKTLRMRDLEFWTRYYDKMAIERRAKARSIIRSPEFEAPDWLKLQLCSWHPLTEMRSRARNARVRASAAQCEAGRGEDGPPDEGYLRCKARAERKLNELNTALRAAA